LAKVKSLLWPRVPGEEGVPYGNAGFSHHASLNPMFILLFPVLLQGNMHSALPELRGHIL
jgi:hypothetical protein